MKWFFAVFVIVLAVAHFIFEIENSRWINFIFAVGVLMWGNYILQKWSEKTDRTETKGNDKH